MNRMSAHQALCAGIGGASLALMPSTAYGITLSGVADQLLRSPFAPFVAGVLGGAAVAGGVYGIVVHVANILDAPASGKVEASSARQASHVSHIVETPVAASLYKPRHMSPQDFEKSGVIRVQPVESYVDLEKQVEVKRQEQKQKHLRSSIIERMGIDPMKDIPVIERADGTVADVGTSWWVRGVEGKTIASTPGFAEETPVDSFLHDKNRLTPQTITHRIAQIDEGLYPEKRTSDDLDRSDMWTSALQALDERLGSGNTIAPSANFSFRSFNDTVGGAETIDEPDDLAEDTGFVSFKIPAGHPEVTDTASYINHIVSDEFSRSSSSTIRSGSRHYMRVIEGGTHGMKINARSASSTNAMGRRPYVGKHFAPLAAQA